MPKTPATAIEAARETYRRVQAERRHIDGLIEEGLARPKDRIAIQAKYDRAAAALYDLTITTRTRQGMERARKAAKS